MSISDDDISGIIGTKMKPKSSLNKSASPENDSSPEGPRGKKDSDKDVSCWANSGQAFWPIAKTFETLPAMCYKGAQSQTGPFLEEIPVVTDDLLILPDDASKQIIHDFEQFWTLKHLFVERGFLHKRGILMWGPPGSGKTSTIQLIIQKVIKDINGIVLMIENPSIGMEALKIIRRIEPTRPVIAIMEDLDSLVGRYDDAGFLSLLDGEAQVDNIVNLATTNYPERLDPRFIDRPSRFDVVRRIGFPSADARRFYLSHKEPSLTPKELDQWVEMSDQMSIPHLKEMIISVRCYNASLEETVERLTAMHKRKFAKEGSGNLGFGK